MISPSLILLPAALIGAVGELDASQQHHSSAASFERPLIISGLGTSVLEPDTANAQARAWFAQGERLVWAFEEVEAARAFREAQRIDPRCSLCFWGEAWALKPTINLRVRYREMPQARTAALKAVALSERLDESGKLLVEAMEAATRGPVFASKSYADELEAAAKQRPGDVSFDILAAEARMAANDWRSFQEGSLTQQLLERALEARPDHSGALHLYIHLTDWLDRPDLAEPHADRLSMIAPAASHLRHMSSHAYFGVGRYADAVQANRAAIEAHEAFKAAAGAAPSANRERLLHHSLYFGVMSALARGDGSAADEFLERLRSGLPHDKDSRMHQRMVTIAGTYVAALHLPPAKVLASPLPQSQFEAIAHRYARGEAQARLGDAEEVEAEAKAIAELRLEENAEAVDPVEPRLAEIYEKVLLGHAAILRQDYPGAIQAYGAAVQAQYCTRSGDDPPIFWYSTRRSLAAALLASGEAAAASAEAERALQQWPNDAATLAVLRCARQALRSKSECVSESFQHPMTPRLQSSLQR